MPRKCFCSPTGGKTMNDAFDIRGESHIEVHKFRAGAIIIATLLALVIQASFPIHFAKAAVLDFPLLVTIYFGLSRRNPSTGLLLGMRSEEHTSELQSQSNLVCRLLLEKKKKKTKKIQHKKKKKIKYSN